MREPEVIPVSRADLRKQAVEGLRRFGVLPNTKGHAYLVEAIVLWAVHDIPTGLPPQVTKMIYPEIAKRFRVRVGAVERGIRYAIGQIGAYDMSRARALREFGIDFMPASEWFTNAQFIALFVSNMIITGNLYA